MPQFVYFFTFINFLQFQEGNVMFFGMGGGNERFCTAVFCENLGLHVRRIGAVDMDISMDIRGKSVIDMVMDKDGKFHIHGKPAYSSRK